MRRADPIGCQAGDEVAGTTSSRQVASADTGMPGRNADKDQDLDPAGERGGDTGKSAPKGDGPQAEKGDQRRDTPVHSGLTRGGSQGTTGTGNKRSGSESNDSR